MSALAEYERRLATALEECITVWNRANDQGRDVFLYEVAAIGDVIRGFSARVPWVEVDVAPIQGPPAIPRVELLESDLKIDLFHVKTDPVNQGPRGVSITHVPTGTVAEAWNGKSQLENKATALTALRLALEEET